MDVFIARQPIFNIKNQVFAYELLYRQNSNNFFDQSITSNVATSILLMNSYFTFGIENLTGEHKAFINFDKHLIESEIPLLLDKNKIVVEMLEDIVPDRGFLQKIEELKVKGYTIAIDDFVEDFEHIRMIELSDIIKVDFFANTKEQIVAIVKKWKPKGKKLLAEKVETQEVFEWAKKLGFEYFQGYYFSKPSMMQAKGMTDSTLQFIRIMEELSAQEPNIKAISSIIEMDPQLTYRLLRLVNHNFTASNKIKSIQHGLSILGIAAFEKLISLAMVQNLGSNKPSELIKISMLRGKFLELIAMNSLYKNNANQLMLIGILSVIDGLLERPMEEVVKELPLHDDILNTLLLKETKYKKLYEMVLAYEKGEFDKFGDCCKEKGIHLNMMNQYYIEAVKWAEDLFGEMSKTE